MPDDFHDLRQDGSTLRSLHMACWPTRLACKSCRRTRLVAQQRPMVAPLMNGRSARHIAAVAGSQIAASSQSAGSKAASVHMNSVTGYSREVADWSWDDLMPQFSTDGKCDKAAMGKLFD